MSLSERFSKLQNKAAGGGNANRKFANFNKQKSVRSVGMNAKRGIVTALMNTKQQNLLRKAQNKKVSEQTRKKKVVAKTKIGTPSKKNAKNTQSTKAKKPAAKKVTPKKAAPKKAAPKKAAAAPKPTNEDLNMEMDQCKFGCEVFVYAPLVYE